MSDEKGEGTLPSDDDVTEAKETATDEAPEKAATTNSKELAAEADDTAEKELIPEPGPVKKTQPETPPPGKKVAAWGLVLAKLDKKWTRLEALLCAGVLLAEIAALCMWISLKGFSAEYTPGGDRSGVLFRGVLAAVIFAIVANKFTAPKDDKDDAQVRKNAFAVIGALVLGFVLAPFWANAGVEWFSNYLNWLQTASFLTLVGGLRGVATRLTLWLALLGASLATAQGKHINIDIVMRFLSPRLRIPAAVLGWAAAAAVCTAAVWGFVDHIAIQGFHAPAIEPCAADPNQSCDVPPGKKLAFVGHALGTDLFLAGRQISLDFKSVGPVLGGAKYSDYFKNAEWNSWLDSADWTAHFAKEDVDGLKVQRDPDPNVPDQSHLPIISIPGSPENVPGMLIKELDFVFPLGLFAIALRFVLRALLVIAGVYTVDPDAVHGEEEVEESQDEQHPKKVPVTS
ncbi:MAG: TRAP transporter small permease subunit [Polyangiaceae bacterium]